MRLPAASALIGLWLFTIGSGTALAQANLDIDTPAIRSLTNSMQQRHVQLAPYYGSGAAGVARDGIIALRDASAVPLAQRAQANALVAAENQDRAALYREIARANGHPEWEADIRAKFAERWVAKAQPGWWVQDAAGNWRKK
ncbi:MAG TPA: YdbL family protein [Longimicrobiales bacterium]|nr:YdbL family protein [Longimicrobiales bacterium]